MNNLLIKQKHNQNNRQFQNDNEPFPILLGHMHECVHEQQHKQNRVIFYEVFLMMPVFIYFLRYFLVTEYILG